MSFCPGEGCDVSNIWLLAGNCLGFVASMETNNEIRPDVVHEMLGFLRFDSFTECLIGRTKVPLTVQNTCFTE